MENHSGITRAQKKFLRGFCKGPSGPGIEHWPSPAVFRRWLRRPRFVAAMRSVRAALRYQSDFQLLSAAATASHYLHTSVLTGDHESARVEMKAFADLMKLAHVRERFAKPEPAPTPSDASVFATLKLAHPDATVRDALAFFHQLDQSENETS
jgi:hypothetical protein